VVCVGSVANCMVSLFSIAPVCVLDHFVTNGTLNVIFKEKKKSRKVDIKWVKK